MASIGSLAISKAALRGYVYTRASPAYFNANPWHYMHSCISCQPRKITTYKLPLAYWWKVLQFLAPTRPHIYWQPVSYLSMLTCNIIGISTSITFRLYVVPHPLNSISKAALQIFGGPAYASRYFGNNVLLCIVSLLFISIDHYVTLSFSIHAFHFHLSDYKLLLNQETVDKDVDCVGCISLGRSIYFKDLAAVHSVHASAEIKFNQKY